MTHEQFKQTIYNLGVALSIGLWLPTTITDISEVAAMDWEKALLFVISLALSAVSSWVGVGLFIGMCMMKGYNG